MYLANMQKTCCEVRYRIVLTDINMPRMDGIEASERIFAEQNRLLQLNPKHPKVMIVAVTAYDNRDTVQRVHQAGIKECLVKPVKPDQLKFVLEYHNRFDLNILEEADGAKYQKLFNQVNRI